MRIASLNRAWNSILTALGLFAVFALGLGILCSLAPVFRGLSPLTTSVFVLVLTVYTFTRWWTGAAALGGIGLYAYSWIYFAAHRPELVLSESICLAGIVLWFAAVYISFRLTPRRVVKA